MKITDLKCAIIGQNPVVRIVTDEGISGYGEAEHTKPYLKPHVLFYKKYILGEDPTNVEKVMLNIRRLGAFKPWGAAVSAIEFALWDIAGKAAGLPVYKLLGGKIRDRVRVYNGAVRFPMTGYQPADYALDVSRMKASREHFTLIKQGVAFHGPMLTASTGLLYDGPREGAIYPNHGPLTPAGLKHIVACVEAMKEALGDDVALALDCGPGFTLPDAIRFAKAMEPLGIAWIEDVIAGDYSPYTDADIYRELTRATSVPVHTGEQIYLRQNFKDLIETHAVSVIGPDPADIGGIAELKWVAEFAEMHGIPIAIHGTADGLIGLAAIMQVAAAMPQNLIAFEYPLGKPDWWYDIVEGLPNPIVKDSFVDVWDRPGLGVEFNVPAAKERLSEEDRDFFD